MATSKPPRPRPILHTAIKTSSIADLQTALSLARSQSPNTYSDFLNQALAATVRAGNTALTTHLLSAESASPDTLYPSDIATHATPALLETLAAHGLDLNAADAPNGDGKSMRLIDLLVGDDALVDWLLADGRGVRVDSGDAFVDGDGYEVEPRPPPLTESCAALGSVKAWKRIREKGARVGRRALHRAAGEAAAVGAFNYDGSGDSGKGLDGREEGAGDEGERERRRREEMLDYLVAEEGLDVNRVDSDTDRAMHWGTPLSYAVQKKDGAGVVQWLLSKGADPRIKSADGVDAFANAKVSRSDEILVLLAKWKESHETA